MAASATATATARLTTVFQVSGRACAASIAAAFAATEAGFPALTGSRRGADHPCEPSRHTSFSVLRDRKPTAAFSPAGSGVHDDRRPDPRVRAWPSGATVLAHAGDDRGHHRADGAGLPRGRLPGPRTAGARPRSAQARACPRRHRPHAAQVLPGGEAGGDHGRGFRQDRDTRRPGPARPGPQLILEDDQAGDLQGGALMIWAGPDIKPGTRPRPRASARGGQCLPRCIPARRPRR